MKIYNITLDLDRPTRTVNIVMKRKDHRSRKIVFNIMSNNACVDPGNIESITIKAMKPDGTVVYDEVENMSYEVIKQLTAAAGEVECELEIFDKNGGVMYSPNFYLTIQDNVYDTEKIVSENYLQGLQAYVASAHEALKQAQEIATEFGLSYGTMEELTDLLESSKEKYVTYMDELQQKVEDGYFNGNDGAKGENGADAIVTEGVGIMGFQIIDGNLKCYYYNDLPPLEINESGHLIYRKE